MSAPTAMNGPGVVEAPKWIEFAGPHVTPRLSHCISSPYRFGLDGMTVFTSVTGGNGRDGKGGWSPGCMVVDRPLA